MSDESYHNFVSFLPGMLLSDTQVTDLDSESGLNLFYNAGVPFQALIRELKKVKEGRMTKPEFDATFLPSYVRLIISSPMNKKELKEKMNPGSLLSFLSSLGWSDVQVVMALITFIERNKCQAPHCPHFSRLRCEGCHVVHYCDTKCQVGLL